MTSTDAFDLKSLNAPRNSDSLPNPPPAHSALTNPATGLTLKQQRKQCKALLKTHTFSKTQATYIALYKKKKMYKKLLCYLKKTIARNEVFESKKHEAATQRMKDLVLPSAPYTSICETCGNECTIKLYNEGFKNPNAAGVVGYICPFCK
jgi:hypothetical protein